MVSSARIALAAAVGAVLLAGAGAAQAAAAGAGSGIRWGRAQEVPGLAALHTGHAVVSAVSCPRTGSCGAGGSYLDLSRHSHAWVVNMAGGRWGRAQEAPGTAALDKGGAAGIASVSCPSPGNCAAGGFYTDGSGHGQAFVADEVHGHWHAAQEASGTAALNQGGAARIVLVSCPSPGNCSAGGDYTDGSGHGQVFVASEVDGRWHAAQEVPGTAALNQGNSAGLYSVSCASAGNCAAGGFYLGAFSTKYGVSAVDAFVVSERDGRWSSAQEVPGTRAPNVTGDARVLSVSCPSPRNCAAGGAYVVPADPDGAVVAFVVSQRNGRWGKARQVPGLPGPAVINASGSVNSVSCASPGNCSAGGYYASGVNGALYHAFVVSEKNGRWGKAEQVPGTASHVTWYNNQVSSVSCPSAGNCGVGGAYGNTEAFVAGQKNGRWHTAEQAPGTAALNLGGDAQVSSVSCPSAGICIAAGSYKDATGRTEAFVGGAR